MGIRDSTRRKDLLPKHNTVYILTCGPQSPDQTGKSSVSAPSNLYSPLHGIPQCTAAHLRTSLVASYVQVAWLVHSEDILVM